MTDLPTTPGSLRSARGTLVATFVLVAATASGCGDGEQTPQGLSPVRSDVDRTAHGGPGSHQPVDPTIRNLDPDLLAAVTAAARDAQHEGVELSITSGWRSRAHQQRLFDEAVTKYGSEDEARRWVSTPDTSAHVTGDAVDIGPTEADDWLVRHGADYGLCQIFANEIWHFELATTPGGRCPDLLPDSSYRG